MNSFDKFSVLFREDDLITAKRAYPLGQVTTDILNWDETVFPILRERAEAFEPAVRQMISAPGEDMIAAAQRKLNEFFDIVRTFPPYCDLSMDWGIAYDVFPLIYEEYRAHWDEAMTEGTPVRQELEEFLRKIRELPERLNIFRSQVMLMLELYFEGLHKRDRESYAQAYLEYYRSVSAGGALLYPDREFEQSFPAKLKFVPIAFKGHKDVPILAEETEFGELHAFLYADFYRGLMHGNAPRRCHNCSRYFLLTRGYNTCYCNNIAPGETERTCRQVGAHRVSARLWAGDTPLLKEYAKTINRIKGQRHSGKISRNDFRTFEDEARALVEQVEHGQSTDEEAIRKLHQISRFRKR